MRSKKVLTLFIIAFVLTGLLVDSVFAMPMDPEKEIVPVKSALKTEPNLVQENVDPPDVSTGSSYFRKTDRTSGYADGFKPQVLVKDINFSRVPPLNSFVSGVEAADFVQDSVQGSSPWGQLNQDGFGDNNFQIPSVQEFEGFLYAGTWKNVDEVTSAEVWRTADGSNWEKVDERGHNGCADLIEFDGYLYCGSWDGAVWRSDDGIAWQDVVTGGFGDPNNGIARFAVYNNMLYAGTWNGTTGAQIWRTIDGTNWTKFGDGLDPANIVVGAISTEIFDGNLYWGTGNWETGAQLWRTDGTTLTKITQGTSPAISSLAAFDGYLYAGVWDATSTQIWRSANGSDWTQLLTFSDLGSGMKEANGLEVYDGMLYLVGTNPDTGLEVWRTGNGTDWEQVGFAGFGDPENGMSFFDNAITTFGGKLIISTNNYNTGGEVWAYVPNVFEVYDVGIWMNLGVKDLIWGHAIPGSDVTIITPRDTIYSYADPNCNGCFEINEPIEINPGDTITVTAGAELYPVDFSVPTPLVVNADSTTEQVTGQIGGWDTQTVAIHGWWENGDQEVTSDASGNFSATFSEIPRGGEGYIHFPTLADGADINYHQYFRAPDLLMDIYPEWDLIEGHYAPGHTVVLIVTDSDDNVKATATVISGEFEWEPGTTGFATQIDDECWDPARPDIVPGDKIYGVVDSGPYEGYAQVGEITGEVDVDTDSITGTINAPWLILDPGEVFVECHALGAPGGAPNKSTTVIPDGMHEYTCAWDPDTEWDVQANQELMIFYHTPEIHHIHQQFMAVSYDLYLHVNYYGDAIEGWYPPGYEVTLTVTESDGITPKATTTITTTEVPWWNGDTGFSTSMDGVVWEPGRPDIQAGDWVFGEVDVDGTIYSAEVQLGEIFGEVDVDTDSISGTIDVPWLDPDVEIEIQCHPWGASGPTDGKQDFVLPDGEDTYYCEWDPVTEWDIQPYQDVGVVYLDPNGHWIYNGFFAYTYDLYLHVNYDHDWIEGNYPPGYEVTLTVTESDGVTVKATTTLTTAEIPGWGGQTGFSTNVDGVVWDPPERPDIQPGDWVFGEVTVDATTYYGEVQLGEFSGELSAETDSYTGKLSGSSLDPEVPVPIQCHPWGSPDGTPMKETSVLPDGISEFTCDWLGEWDVQPGQNIGILYQDPGGHWIYSAPVAYTDELILNIQYDHDWIDGNYREGHEIFLRVLDNLGNEKAHITLTSGFIDGWGSTTGFSTNMEGATWQPNHPDIQPGDTIYGEVDGGAFTAQVTVGTITADLDLDYDKVSGTVDAEWLPQGNEVRVSCEIWEPYSPPSKDDWVLPTGSDPYLCDWTSDGYDLNETSNLMVAYFEAAGHKLIGEFRYPAPRLRIEKWLEGGEPGEGGIVTFNIQYSNEGNAPAVNAIITDTFVQGLTYLSDTSGLPKTIDGDQVIWQLGDLAPGDWVNFFVFAHVEATEGNDIINTAVISSDGFDAGNEEDRTRTWQGTVIANNTHVNVGKGTWTWLPAPGQDYVYNINVCNNGPTGSTELTLTEILPGAVTLDSWWGREPGWSEVSYTANILTLEYPSIPGGMCREVFVKVSLDPNAQPDDELINIVNISAENDNPDEQDNEAWLQHNVGSPFTDLSVSLGWHWGVLTPGGQYRFGVYFYNDGNVPVEGPMPLVLTLPPGTQFAGWKRWDWANLIGEPIVDGNTVTWLVDDLDPGYYGTIEVIANIDSSVAPGTELIQTVVFTPLTGEENIDNNTASLTETVFEHGPNLRIKKWGDWHGHGEGHYAWYHLQVENIGDETVEDVLVTDTLPTGMVLDGDIGVGFWEYSEVTDYGYYFTVFLDRLEPGWNVGMDFNVVIPGDDPVPWGQVFANIATVTVDPADTNPEDNSAEFVLGTGTDMFVEKTWLNGEFLPGEQVEFLLLFGNKQPGHTPWWGMMGNAILVDTLPEGMSFVSSYWHCYQGEEWCEIIPAIDGQELTWETWSMDAGERQVIVLTVLIDDEIQEGNALINTFEISSDQPAVDLDPFPANNISTYDPEVDFEAPSFTSADNTTFAFGEVGSFTITTSGFPTPMIWTDDGLPSWLTLEDQGDGTAILSGTPPEDGGVDYILLKAANGVTPNAEQSFTLTWEGKPDYRLFLPLILR